MVKRPYTNAGSVDQGSLCFYIEFPHGADPVSIELHADRRVPAYLEDIQDPTPERELTLRFDDLVPLVA